MANLTLVCVKCTASSNGGFILTWKNMVVTPLGTMFPTSNSPEYHSYCTKSSVEVAVNTSATIDLNQWEVQTSEPFVGNDGAEHTTKWLKPRA